MMYTKDTYSRVSENQELASNEGSDNSQDRDSLFAFEEKCRSPPRSFSLRRRLPWIAHGVAFLIWLGFFVYTMAVSHREGRKCIEKFNAYCKFDIQPFGQTC